MSDPKKRTTTPRNIGSADVASRGSGSVTILLLGKRRHRVDEAQHSETTLNGISIFYKNKNYETLYNYDFVKSKVFTQARRTTSQTCSD